MDLDKLGIGSMLGLILFYFLMELTGAFDDEEDER